MILHESKDDFDALITLCSARYNIMEEYVIKDYYLTRSLRNLSYSDCKEYTVFKGGTSLSKVYNVIHRFSEDIDLVVLDPSELSGNQRKLRLRNIVATASANLEADNDFNGTKGSNFRKQRYHVPSLSSKEGLGEVSETILIECNSFSKPVPINIMPIRSLIAEYLIEEGKTEEISEYELEDFELNVLCWTRTFCEKLLGLIKSAYLSTLDRSSRHFYDLTMMLRSDEIATFLQDDESFFYLINCVCDSDHSMAKEQNAKWISDTPNLSECALLLDPGETWEKVKSSYDGRFQDMITKPETAPTEDEIKAMLYTVKIRLNEFYQSQQVKVE
ncbi:TPA: nucleotidyl transferase AbiEii/AbiGii toxin family protein [Vibrio diabolicus]